MFLWWWPVCEIKSQESIYHQATSSSNYAHLFDNGGTDMLKSTSEHYFQIMGQMAVLRRCYCDFFVYTCRGHHLERINFNSNFWDRCLYNRSYFWHTFVAPELIYGAHAHKLDKNSCDLRLDQSYALAPIAIQYQASGSNTNNVRTFSLVYM